MIIGKEIEGIEITKDMVEAVVLAKLYREDVERAVYSSTTQKIKKNILNKIIDAIITDDDFEQIKQDTVAIEEKTLIDDNLNTVMLQYNRLLAKAQEEGKYEVAARILKEIRAIKAIENEQTKFEVIIRVEEPKKDESQQCL